MTVDEKRFDCPACHADRSPIASTTAADRERVLHHIRRQTRKAQNQTPEMRRHLPDYVLYDLALGELAAEERSNARRHLAACSECITRLSAFQAAMAADRKVGAVWKPTLLYAAGESDSTTWIRESTVEGKYELTLQPTDDDQRDLLTLTVTPPFRPRLEKVRVIVVSSKGTVVLQGTISGGDITRLIPRALRDEWPFRIHAA